MANMFREFGSVLKPFVFVVISWCPLASAAGPLTDILLKSVEGHGEMFWETGVLEDGREVLDGITLFPDRLPFLHVITFEQLVLSHAEEAYVMEGRAMRMETKAGRMFVPAFRFRGGPGLLQALWSGFDNLDFCRFGGTSSVLSMEAPRWALEGESGAEASLRAKGGVEMSVSFEGTRESCVARLRFRLDAWEYVHDDGSSLSAESLDLDVAMPGSLDSISIAPEREIRVSLEVGEMGARTPEGVRAWLVGTGRFAWRMAFIDVVSPLTLFLESHASPRGGGMESLSRTWTILQRVSGEASARMDGVTVRSANVVQPQHVVGFHKAGLRTMLLDIAGKSVFRDGRIGLEASLDVDGLGQGRIEADLDMADWPESSSPTVSWARMVPPIHVDKVRYAQVDKGFIDAVGDIMGQPFTVWLERMRTVAREERPELAAMVNVLTAMLAEFVVRSYSEPPAVLEATIVPELTLRDAVRLMEAFPTEILEIMTLQLADSHDTAPALHLGLDRGESATVNGDGGPDVDP